MAVGLTVLYIYHENLLRFKSALKYETYCCNEIYVFVVILPTKTTPSSTPASTNYTHDCEKLKFCFVFVLAFVWIIMEIYIETN